MKQRLFYENYGRAIAWSLAVAIAVAADAGAFTNPDPTSAARALGAAALTYTLVLLKRHGGRGKPTFDAKALPRIGGPNV